MKYFLTNKRRPALWRLALVAALCMPGLAAQAQTVAPGALPGPAAIDAATRQAQPQPSQNLPDKHQGKGAFRTPVWSPDGGKIAFIYDSNANMEVYVSEADGSNPVNVSNSPGMDVWPAWRPDGKALAFMSNRNGPVDICTVNADGADLKCVTAESKKSAGRRWDDRFPVWRPDGRAIAYCSYRAGYPQVWFMEPDGRNPRLFVEGTKIKEQEKKEFTAADTCYPHYSANGRTLAFASRGDIYTMDLKTGRTKNVTAPLIRGNMVDDTMPTWAPRGNRLAFIARFEAYQSEVYTISSSGKQVRRITDNLLEDFLPAWTPDGKGLVYAGYVRGRQPELFIANPMGPLEPAKRLTDNFDLEMYPAISPDGEKIIFVRRVRGRDELYIMSKNGEVDGQPARQFFPNGFSPMARAAAATRR